MNYKYLEDNTNTYDNATPSLSHESTETAKSAFSSSDNFIQTSKRNPCPICSDASGACRQGKNDQDYWLCMTFIDWRKGEVIGDYRCLGSTKNGQWAQFKPDNSSEWSEEKKLEWEAKKERRNAEKARINRDARQKSLSDADRHEQYSQLFNELKATNGLKPEHRADLIRRGLSDAQIELLGAVSFIGYQELQREYCELLPGIALGGRSISVGGSGYIYPIKNALGQITGAQIRAIAIGQDEPSHEARQQPKYKWFSGGRGRGILQIFPDSQQRGELPLAVHYPSEIKNFAIGLCEGTGVKPFLAAQRLGIPFIGASGGQHSSSPGLLFKAIREIQNWFCENVAILHNVKDCNIQLYPDAGCLQNPSVMRQIEATLALLKDYSPAIAWWNQNKKAIGDIDEISPSTPIEFLTPSEFLNLATPQKVTFQAKQEEAEKVTFQTEETEKKEQEESEEQEEQKKQEAFKGFGNPKIKEKPAWLKPATNKWKRKKSLKIQQTLESSKGWFEFAMPKEATMLFVRSGLGTGKTTQLKKWVAELEEEGWLLLGYRNTLLLQFCNAVKSFEHLHEHNGKERIADKQSKIALCLDSLGHFRPEDFEGKNLVLDEVMSVIRHLHTSSTIKFPDKIQYLFSEAIKRSKRVICLDGLLADWAVEYIGSIDPTKEVITVQNVSKQKKAPINFLLGTELEEKIKTFDRSPWLKLLFEGSRTPAICSDSQIFCEALDNLLSALGLKVLRLDSKTVSEKYAKDFLSNCDVYIANEKPDVLIYSPTAESGLDISIKSYFTHHFGFFFGVLGVDSIIQMLGRIRDVECPKFVWVQEWSTHNDIGINSPHEEVIQQAKKAMLLLEITEIIQSPNAEDSEKLIKDLKQLIKDNNDVHFKASCTLTAISNFERSNLRDCLWECLKTEGYYVKLCIEESDEAIASKVKAEAKIVRKTNCAEIFNAEKIPLDEAKENAYDASWEERVKTIQAGYRRRLPGIENTELWSPEFIELIRYKDRSFVNASEMRWLLRHPKVALRMQQKMWSDKLWYPPEQISLIRMRSRRAVVEALSELEIEQYLEPGLTFHQDCEEFKATVAMGRQKDIIAALGFQPGKQAPAQYIGKLLALIGYELGSEQAREKDSERKRTYFIKDSNAATRSIVLECLSRKWSDYLEKSEPLFWEPQKIAPVPTPMTDETELGVDELEDVDPSAIVPDESDIGKIFDVQRLEGINGASSDTFKITWEPGYKLLELPSKHREFYVFESPEGSRTVAYEGEFSRTSPHSSDEPMELEKENIPEVFQILS